MEQVFYYLHQLSLDPLFTLFLILGLGLMLGAIRIKGFSLGVSGVFIVGMLFGIAGFVTPKHLTTYGLYMFMYVLGIQGGPAFFNSFSKRGIPYLLVTLCMIVASIIAALIAGKLSGLDDVSIMGVYLGIFNNSSGLAILMEGVWGDSILPSYGLIYPIGAVGAVFFVQFLPMILKKNVAAEFLRHREQKKNVIFKTGKFVVENEEITNKKLSTLNFRQETGATISRMMQDGKLIVPTGDTVLLAGDVIMAIGDEASQEKVRKLVGYETHENLDVDPTVVAQQFVITNQYIHNTTLAELGIGTNFKVVVSRIQRAGIELPPHNTLALETGDVVTVVGKKRNIKKLEKLFGKGGTKSAELDLISLALGVGLGIALGKITINLPIIGNFTLGMTGGILLVGLFLGYARRFGFLTNQISDSAKNIIKNIGLSIFCAGIGASSGMALLNCEFSGIPPMIITSLVILIVNLFSVFLLSYKILKMDFVKSLACVCGSTFNSAAADSVVQMAGDDEPATYFATCYPLATFGAIIACQILGHILLLVSGGTGL